MASSSSPYSKQQGGSTSPSVRIRPPNNTSSLTSPYPANNDELGATLSRSHSASSRMTNTEESEPAQTTRAGGCWTCRLRRKKCDEIRTDGSCATCLRLKIVCLGWGSKKPDWMRDKEQVELYKSQIKQQLIRSGRIRGQPKSLTATSRPPSAPTLPTVPAVPSLPSASASSGPSLNEFLRAEDPTFDPYAADSSSSSGRISASPMMPLTAGRWGRHNGNYQPYPRRFSDPCHYTLVPSTPDDFSQSFAMNLPSASSSYSPHSPASISYINTPPTSASGDLQTTHAMFGLGLEDSPRHYQEPWQSPSFKVGQERLGIYYFKHVLQYQFALSDGTLLNTISQALVNQPDSPVTHALCALAGLHATKTGLGVELGIDATVASTYTQFFQSSYYQLGRRKELNGQYSEMDAMAAIQLISYLVLAGGTGDWHTLLAVAGDWLERSPINLQQNPKMVLLSSSDVVRFTCRAVMWMDIFSSINFRRAPRFYQLYQRLFRSGSGYWSSSSGPELEHMRMDALMGCPDDVMLAFAETAALEAWKEEQRLNGSLSIQTLCERSKPIEVLLRPARPSPSSSLHPHSVSHHSSPVNTSGTPSTSSPVSLDLPLSYSPSNIAEATELPSLVAEVFRYGALLYLYTVLNGNYPHVPEVRGTVQAIINCIKRMPVTSSERALVLPIFLAGCLADDQLERAFFRNRLSVQDPHIGNIAPAFELMQAVWNRRTMQGGEVDWRFVMSELGYSLLLV